MGTLYLLQTRTMDFVRVEFNQFEVCLKKRLTQVLAKVEDEVSLILSLLCLSFIIIHHHNTFIGFHMHGIMRGWQCKCLSM